MLSFALRVIALLVFILVAAGVALGSLGAVALLAIGLALWVASTLVDQPWSGRPVA